MDNFNKDNPAIVLGAFETGLGVVRSLGRLGIRVYVFDYKKDIAFYSRYAKGRLCPDPQIDESSFINFLIEQANSFHAKAVLYITGDEFLLPVIKHAGLISEHYLLNLPDMELVLKITNKYEQYQLAKKNGIPVPEGYAINSEKDLDNIKSDLRFPVFVKGLDAVKWRSAFGGSKKGFVINDLKELDEISDIIFSEKVAAIVQELIVGPETNHYKFSGYVDKKGELVAGFCLQKIRQHPIHFGVGCCVQSVENSVLMELGSRFFKSIHYKGIGSAEFKLDEKDNTYKLIELNPRYWQQNSLPTTCGINFPLLQYLDLTDQPFRKMFEYKTAIKWVNIYSDFDSFLTYRKEGSLSFLAWLKSLRGKKIFSDIAWDDSLPNFYEIRFGKRLVRLPKYFFKKFFSV